MSEQTYQLVVTAGPQPGRVYPLVLDAITIGRDPLADVVISDPEISRQHAQLVRRDGGYAIQDLGSTNGTFLDGRRLTGEPQPVSPGQSVSLGSTVSLTFDAVALEDVVGSVAGIEPIPDPLGSEAITDAEPDDEEAVSEAAEASGAEAAEEAPAEETPAEETPAVEPAAADPFSDPAWEEALAPISLPDFRFDDAEAAPPPPEPEPLPSFGAETAEPVPDFSSYQPQGSPPPPAAPPEPPRQEGGNRRTLTIVLAIIAVLILCCCGFLAVMYFWLGDLLLDWMDLALTVAGGVLV